MQDEAVAESVRILREHIHSNSGGIPLGQARGKIILPCGTGKTRISLRIIEELTPEGKLSVVLCPSIALVAQIRREYLNYKTLEMRVLAVCSDETAGYDPSKESSRNTALDPTQDNSNVSATEVKGEVTTNPREIATWIHDGHQTDKLSIIFGTYQSGRNIADALRDSGAKITVLISDEAHRTAGLRRIRKSSNSELTDEEKRIRDFTLCHDNDEFPAEYRIYQTATPRIYDFQKVKEDKPSDWIVRSMDDESVFGVELYRKSYAEAVKNGWLSNYRIIALGVNDPEAFEQANILAKNTESEGSSALTASHYLRGLAFSLAMGGATQGSESGNIPIKSCITFMNTVKKSKIMTRDLQTPQVREWLQNWLDNNRKEQKAIEYKLEHLDATSNVTARDNAKYKLAEATELKPYGVFNVGIFGEGTDSPSLSAVAFLEPRKSPIDVIQAVGRAMRTAPGKDLGYIICPILIPPNCDPEQWLSTSNKEDGWQELGQILLALRAHDQRIEDNLADLLHLYLPKPPEVQRTFVAIARKKRIQYWIHEGAPGEAEIATNRVLGGDSPSKNKCYSLDAISNLSFEGSEDKGHLPKEPTEIITGKLNNDGSAELRINTVARTNPSSSDIRGKVDIKKTKEKAKKMINKGEGVRIKRKPRRKRTPEEIADESAFRMLNLSGLGDFGNAIKMNLLSKSGLVVNRVVRDLNVLESSVKEAAYHLRSDELQPTLNRHFNLDNLKESKLRKQADGSTIAALLIMNAAMLHQRIANSNWLPKISSLSTVKNDTKVIRRVSREWEHIMRHDFRPVLEPAVNVIEAIEDTGKLSGLERALHHLTAEAERIAETYAEMGADHAGLLFNKVMGNQASDGAFFTRPVAATMAAQLTLDACEDINWANIDTWKNHKIVDLACGSGALLVAMLTDMKRRAREKGANELEIANLQKLAVEKIIKGLDINIISMQLAASQLTAGNKDIRYRQMGLHLMPYGPQSNNALDVFAGTLELLGRKTVVSRNDELELAEDEINTQSIWYQNEDVELEDAVDAVIDARVVIMNPPFTNRSLMGEKFPKPIQAKLRSRVDDLGACLISRDETMRDFLNKNTLAPMFAALADKCLLNKGSVLTLINPTSALSAPSALYYRRILAQRYHIQTILTCHQPGQVNLSQNTDSYGSIIVAKRFDGQSKPPTRFVNLDRFPVNDSEVADMSECISHCLTGLIPNGWGEISEWPAERIESGDWTPAIWRSPELAEAGYRYSNHENLIGIKELGFFVHATGQVLRSSFEKAGEGHGGFPIIKSASSDGQKTLKSHPDEYWLPKKNNSTAQNHNREFSSKAKQLLKKAGYILITAVQNNMTARLTAVASNDVYVGNGWMPVTGTSLAKAKAMAVFINSTVGRLQLMRNSRGETLVFPNYSVKESENLRVPNINDERICQILADTWEQTQDIEVPQFRDGECKVRRLWDDAVASAMQWDNDELKHLRLLLHQEPHVRGLGYNQFEDELVD